MARANTQLKQLINKFGTDDKIAVATAKLKLLKQRHRKLVRKARMNESVKRDSKLDLLRSEDPTKCFNDIRMYKSKSRKDVQKLKVGNKIYEDDEVPDGFFDSISTLKKLDAEALSSSSSYSSIVEDYQCCYI